MRWGMGFFVDTRSILHTPTCLMHVHVVMCVGCLDCIGGFWSMVLSCHGDSSGYALCKQLCIRSTYGMRAYVRKSEFVVG